MSTDQAAVLAGNCPGAAAGEGERGAEPVLAYLAESEPDQ
jgi:hypothetical protein